MRFNGATISLIGRPGSGKGTQTRLLRQYLEKQGHKKILFFSVGELFRQLCRQKTSVGRWTEQMLAKGILPPGWLAVSLWVNELKEKLVNNDQVVIIDGAPRRTNEAEILDELIKGVGRRLPIAIVLEISEEEAWRRLASRRREDDVSAAIKRRLKWYKTDVVPMIKHWGERAIKVDGEGSVDEVYKRIIESLNGDGFFKK